MPGSDTLLPKFFHKSQNGFQVIGVDNPETMAVMQSLLPDPDCAFKEEHMVKPGSRTHAGFVTLHDKIYFLKRYNCRNWQYRFFNALRRSRALRAWETTWALWQNNVPVPRPLLFIEERQARLLGRSYVLMDSLQSAERLVEAWANSDAQRHKELLGLIASTLGAMHASGGVHGDLKWSNLLVEDSHEVKLFLVDLDGSRMLKAFRRSAALKDLRRFLKDLSLRDESGEYEDFFLRRWEKSLDESLSQRSVK